MKKILLLIVMVFLTNCTKTSELVDDGIVYKIPLIKNVVIDGSDDDWMNNGFDARLFADHLGKFSPEKDLSSKINLAWNEKGLLVFIDVWDDSIYESSKDQPLYYADCIEMFIADKRNGMDAVQFVISPGLDKQFPEMRVMKFDNRRSKDKRNQKLELEMSSNKTENGYTVEVLIPFNLLLIKPELEQELAFQIYVNDRDNKNEKQVQSVKWHHLHGAHKLFSAYNRIILSKGKSSSQTMSVKCNVIDEKSIHFYIIGNIEHVGETVTIDIGGKNSINSKLQKQMDYAFAFIETTYPKDASGSSAIIKVNGKLTDVINLEEAWRIYKDTKAPNVYESDIQQFERMDRKNPPPKNAILFIGDSNIRMWTNLQEDMDVLPVFNRGFGGSKSEDLVVFADRIILPYKPKIIVVGSGNNDVNAGLATEITIANYHKLIKKIQKALPQTQIFLLSTKPSPSVPHIIELKRALNPELIKVANQYDLVEYINVFDPLFDKNGHLSDSLYIWDRAHLNENGYAIWTPVIKDRLLKAWEK